MKRCLVSSKLIEHVYARRRDARRSAAKRNTGLLCEGREARFIGLRRRGQDEVTNRRS